MGYDLIIVGAGPSGLALAQCMRSTYSKILIIESEAEIGGLHRVIRVPINGEELFTEHSPRIYSNSYQNFQTLLKDMNTDFTCLFTPYNFSISEIGGQTVFSTFSRSEFLSFGLQFIPLIFNSNYGMDTTVGQFMDNNNFSESSKDLVNRLTRLTDGAGADKFTLNEFLEIFNQQFFYKLYQPKRPNDQGLFSLWGAFLESNGVEIMLNTKVNNIKLDSSTNTVSSITFSKLDGSSSEVSGSHIVLALPPESILSVLSNCPPVIQNSFMNYTDLQLYAQNTAYITYISMTFHWDTKLHLPKVYGFPRSEWGIAFIILSDYMIFTESQSKTVITCTITFTDVPSTVTGKTANQYTDSSTDITDLLKDVLRQLKEAFPDLPNPTASIISPEMRYTTGSSSSPGHWTSSGKAFITASNEGFIPFSGTIPNLYNLGTHNGYQKYKFTSLESAVTNSIALSHVLDPNLKGRYPILGLFTFSDFVITMVFIIILIIGLIIIYNKIKWTRYTL